MQKRSLRTIFNKKYNCHTDPLFKRSGIIKLHDLYQLEVMLFMHDYIHMKLPWSFRNTFSFNADIQNAYATRQAHMFYFPRTKSRFVDKLPLFQFPAIWNSLSTGTDINATRNQMKKSMKRHFINKYNNVVVCSNALCVECSSQH